MFDHPIWKNPPRGFRLMPWDPVALAICALATWWLWPTLGAWTLIMPFVLGHFFLFCNVFRIARVLELAWVAAFLALEGTRLLAGTPSTGAVVCIALACSVCAGVIEMRRPSYHGVLWKAVNPGLRDWFDAQQARRQAAGTADGAGPSA